MLQRFAQSLDDSIDADADHHTHYHADAAVLDAAQDSEDLLTLVPALRLVCNKAVVQSLSSSGPERVH